MRGELMSGPSLHVVVVDLARGEGVAVIDAEGDLRAADDVALGRIGPRADGGLARFFTPGLEAQETAWPPASGAFSKVVAGEPFEVRVTNVCDNDARFCALEEERRRLFEHALTARFIADEGGTILECNRVFGEVFGGANRIGSSVFELWPDVGSRDAFFTLLREAGQVDRLPIQMMCTDGRQVFAVVNAFTEVDRAGRVTRIHGAIFDRTEEQRLEEQLLHAQRIEAVGRLAGGIAHDFNNLLTVVLSYAQMLERTLPAESAEVGWAGEIRKAGDRAAELTNRLLSFGRRQVVRAKDVNLNELLVSSRGFLRSLLPTSIEIDLIPAHDLASIHADANLLEQVIMNLAMNARDAMPNGGRLTIETENVSLNGAYTSVHPWAKPGRYVLLTLSDTGCGMPREVLEHAFEPFFTTKPPGKGSGLGLASSYGIVKQHEGLIHAYSEPGVGTTFKVYLPIATRAASIVGHKIARRIVGGRETILVAEDEPAVRDVCRQLLEAKGYEVLEAPDGEEAVRLLQKELPRIALVVLDVVMPGIGGVAAYEQVRRIAPRMPVLFTSGYSGDVLSRLLESDGRADFIPKPYDPDQLFTKVRAALDAPGERDDGDSTG